MDSSSALRGSPAETGVEGMEGAGGGGGTDELETAGGGADAAE